MSQNQIADLRDRDIVRNERGLILDQHLEHQLADPEVKTDKKFNKFCRDNFHYLCFFFLYGYLFFKIV